jgi:hypothetical protein
MNAQTVRELNDEVARLTRRIDQLTRQRDELGADLRRALEDPTLTATLDRVREAAPQPPFLVILNDTYDGSDPYEGEPARLRGDDALTFNGLLADYPRCALRLVNVAVHDAGEAAVAPEDAPLAPLRRPWELLLEDGPGWLGEDAGPAGAAAAALRGLCCYYGGYGVPGSIHSTREPGEMENGHVGEDQAGAGSEPIHNLSWTLLLVEPAEVVD